jgi:rare lipoprotein A
MITLLVGTTFCAQSIFSGKKNQTKAKVDSIIKKSNVAEKEVAVTDTVVQYQGKFKPFKKTAHASYYADRFNGRRTASGRVYDKNKLTAAHKSLPFGTKVRVTNLANGKSVIVEVIDRGPFVRGREIDLSRKAFYSIATSSGMGYINVALEILQK